MRRIQVDIHLEEDIAVEVENESDMLGLEVDPEVGSVNAAGQVMVMQTTTA